MVLPSVAERGTIELSYRKYNDKQISLWLWPIFLLQIIGKWGLVVETRTFNSDPPPPPPPESEQAVCVQFYFIADEDLGDLLLSDLTIKKTT